MTTPTPPTMGVELPPLPEERLKRLDFQAHRDTDCKTGSWAHLLTFARLIEADHRAAIAADRQSASRATPEGWVLVPREATSEMLNAYWDCIDQHTAGGTLLSKAADRYRALIAAAPPVAVEATKAVAPSLDKLMDAFITSETCGPEKSYALVFKYPTYEALSAAQDQLHAYCIANKEPK